MLCHRSVNYFSKATVRMPYDIRAQLLDLLLIIIWEVLFNFGLGHTVPFLPKRKKKDLEYWFIWAQYTFPVYVFQCVHPRCLRAQRSQYCLCVKFMILLLDLSSSEFVSDSLTGLLKLCTVEKEIDKCHPIFIWGTLQKQTKKKQNNFLFLFMQIRLD